MTDVERGPASENWRAGAAAVIALTVEVDGDAGADTGDLSAMSYLAYGPRVGLPRILQLIGLHQVPATFFVPGVIAERWPSAVESIVLAGHEIALHGHAHRALTELSDQEQTEDFEKGLQALKHLGVTPQGYRAPLNRLTRHTLDLVAQHGLAYDSSLMDDDRPYRLRTANHGIAELPVHHSLDDAFPPHDWAQELQAMRDTASLCVLTVHDYLSGRPGRLKELGDFLAQAKQLEGVRFSRADEVARSVWGR